MKSREYINLKKLDNKERIKSSDLIKALKADLKEIPGESVSLFFNSISEKVMNIYNLLDIKEKFKFVYKYGFDFVRLTRRCGKYHHKAISELKNSNKISMIKGRLLECKEEDRNLFTFKYKTKNKIIKEKFSVCKIINCTGLERLNDTSNALINNLLRRQLIFVFGTNVFYRKAANHIENALQNSSAKKCIITGGIADYYESEYEYTPESTRIYENIDVTRFKNVHFYLEKKSKNNLENVINASKIVNFTNIESIICISHSHASNRSVQTLRKIFSKKIYSYPYDIYGENSILVDRNIWSQNKEGKAIVWGEYLRIKAYGERGDFPLTQNMKSLISKIEEKM